MQNRTLVRPSTGLFDKTNSRKKRKCQGRGFSHFSKIFFVWPLFVTILNRSCFTWNIFNTSPALFRFAPIRRKTYELANLLEYTHNFARNLIKITRYSFASSLAFLRTSYAHYAQNLALPSRPNYAQKMKKVLSEVTFIWLRTCNLNWAKYFLTPKQAMP